MIVSQISAILVSIVDAAVVGHSGVKQLAAVGAAAAVIAVATEVIGAFYIGLQVVLGRLEGAGQSGAAKMVLFRFLVFAAAASTVAATCLAIGGNSLFWFINDAPTQSMAATYLALRAPSLVIDTLYVSLHISLATRKLSRPGMCAALTGNAVNLLLAPLLVFGMFGLPALLIVGAGIAGTTASLAQLAVIFSFWRRQNVPHEPEEAKNRVTPALRDLAKLSTYETVNAILDYGGNLLFVGLVGTVGAVGLAVNRVGFSVLMTFFVVCSCVANAAQILLARSYARNSSQDVGAEYMRASFQILGLVVLVFAVIFGALGPLVAHLYGTDPEFVTQLSKTFGILSLVAIPLSLNCLLTAQLRAQKRSKSVMWINIAAVWGIQVPLTWLFLTRLHLPVAWAYVSVFGYFAFRAVWSGWVVYNQHTLSGKSQMVRSLASQSK